MSTIDRRRLMLEFAAAGVALLVPVPLAAKVPRPAQIGSDQTISAFVIGVSYNKAPANFHLPNTLSDARLMSTFLQNRRNTKVQLITDPTVDSLNADLATFLGGLSPEIIAFIYYAGHGVQIDGVNYIVTAEAEDLVPIGDIVEQARKRAKLVVLFMDACRNNPFEPSVAGGAGGSRSIYIVPVGRPQTASTGVDASGAERRRSLSSVRLNSAQIGVSTGLAQFHLQGRGVKVVFSTDPGNVALDSDRDGKNSPFTASLVKSLSERKSLDEVLADVTHDVVQSTGGHQTPWVQGSLEETVYVAGKPERYNRGDMKMPVP